MTTEAFFQNHLNQASISRSCSTGTRDGGVDVQNPDIQVEGEALFELVRGAFHTPLGDLVDRQLFESSVGDISLSVSHEEEWAHLTWCLVVGGVWLIVILLLGLVVEWRPRTPWFDAFRVECRWILFPLLLAFGPWFYWEGFDRLKHEMDNDSVRTFCSLAGGRARRRRRGSPSD